MPSLQQAGRLLTDAPQMVALSEHLDGAWGGVLGEGRGQPWSTMCLEKSVAWAGGMVLHWFRTAGLQQCV